MPGLALPFAATGAAAGWLSATFLSNPLIDLFCVRQQELATLVAGAVGAVCGAALTRRCKPGSRFDDDGAVIAPVLLTTIAGGMVAGSIVCAFVFGTPSAAVHGAFSGAPLGALFLPVCLVVTEAARRAARARLGSIVARADHREVFAVLAAALGVATLLVVPEWPASFIPGTSSAVGVGSPWVGIVMLAGALFLHLALLALDARGVRAIRALSRQATELEPGVDPDREATSFDLGLGEELHGRTTRAKNAYRDRVRTDLVLIGSPARALAALRTAMRRKVFGAALIVGALLVHALAAQRQVAIAVLSRRCDAGSWSSCVRAADMTVGLAANETDPVMHAARRAAAADFHERVCRSTGGWATLRRSCVEAAIARETAVRGGLPDTSRAQPLRQRACEARDMQSCVVLARTLVRTEHRSRDLQRAGELFGRACSALVTEPGLSSSCASAQVAMAAAHRGGSPMGVAACLEGDAAACDREAADWRKDDPSYADQLASAGEALRRR